MANGMILDSYEVRRAANQVGQIARDVSRLATSNVRSMQDSVEENLRGEAANALDEVLGDLSGDIRKISAGLDNIQRALLELARRAEEAEREAEQVIRG